MKKVAAKKSQRVGASPLPKGKRKKDVPMFKKADESKDADKKRDITGQTDTTLTQMKQRLKEVPKKSSGSKADKEAYNDEEGE